MSLKLDSKQDKSRLRSLSEAAYPGRLYAHSKTGEKPALSDRKIMPRNSQSGKEREVVFISQKVAERLKCLEHYII
jgi:hypothetical protein